MGKDRGSELHDHHNDGERDHAEGRGYSPPHGAIDKIDAFLKDTVGATRDAEKKVAEDNEAYKKGWRNVDK